MEVRMGMVWMAVAATVACAHAGLAAPASPRISAKAAVVMDAATGRILWERDGKRPLPPASTTKVVSAILALESGRLAEPMRVSPTAAATPASKLYLRSGQRMRLEHLVYAMLLNSANDASVVVAEGLAGSQVSFGREMTRRAQGLGAQHSSFVNPHGLTAAGHLASASDLATVFRYALGVPRFRSILETQSIQVPVQSPRARSVTLRSHNRLLRGYRYKVIGKTGYTRAAGRCFVGSARNGSREVIIAFLGSRNLWADARALFEFGLGRDVVDELGVQTARASDRAPARAPAAKSEAAAVPTARSRAAVVATARTSAAVAEGDVEEPDLAPPPTAAVAAGKFTVCLGPYADAASAQQARTRLERRGYAPLVSGSSLTLGSFSSRERAAWLASRLREAGYAPSVIAVE